MTTKSLLHRATLLMLCCTALWIEPRAASAAGTDKPTIVLVHGAMADSTSWDGVIPKLQAHGYTVVAAVNPLRSLKSDADSVSSVLNAIQGPVVLVGHSYGGAVITNAAIGHNSVRALVYVAAVAPDTGESTFDLVGKYPGSELGAALRPPVELTDGAHDLSVQPEKFREPFAADLPLARITLMAVTQRPVTDVALKDPSGAPAWKILPSWFIYGDADKSIPPAAHAFMASRAKARQVVVVKGASHVVMISHPGAVARIIEEAARTE
jgi:pimeloyl-ACP methyl ester carboxylesterase